MFRQITDIAEVVKTAREIVPDERLYIVCDSTWTTPVLTKPIDLGKTVWFHTQTHNRSPHSAVRLQPTIIPFRSGVDAVIHSITKYIGGHSDLIGGMVVTADTAAGTRLHEQVCHIVSDLMVLTMRLAYSTPVSTAAHRSNRDRRQPTAV